jgi:hypothetical protein
MSYRSGRSVSGPIAVLVAVIVASLLVACGGSSGSKVVTPPPATVAITMSTAPATVVAGQQVQFAAIVTGSTNTAVTWSVVEAGGGSVASTGMYTAPSGAGTFTVKATSVADATKSATATITVTAAPVVAVAMSTAPTTVVAGGQAPFAASVTGSTNTAVIWTATGGTVSASGLYTAGAAAGSFAVTATSVADPTKSASAAVAVTAAAPVVAVTVSPTTASVAVSATQQFTATVTGNANTAVTWSATSGTVSAAGLYTAPAAAGSFVVTATSVADPTKSASATVTVTAAPVVAVAISPTTASILTNATQQFTATVTGNANTAVTWSATGGTVSAAGLYTAPAAAGSFVVTATSVADPTKSASATVTVTVPVVPVVVTIAPPTVTLGVNTNFQFSATASGANPSVTWTVTEALGGLVDNTGFYTSPAGAGTFHVVATSVADPTKSAAATVTVTAPPAGITVAISPTATVVNLNATQQFTATVSAPAGTPAFDTSVTWAIVEGTATGGTVDNNGLYTAPGTAGVFHVVATSNADTAVTATAKVTVSAATLRTVSGTRIDSYWTATGLVQVPNDLSLTSFAALVPNPDGTYTNLPGQGLADGTFTIPSVPVGNYWLVLADTNEQYLTSSDTYDLGQDFSGRPTSAACDIKSNLNITGLDSVVGSSLEFVVPNHFVVPNALLSLHGNEVDSIDSVPDLAITYVGPNPSGSCFPASPLDPTAGDEAFIIQMEPSIDVPNDFIGNVTGASLDLGNLFSAAAGSTINLAGLADSLTGSSLLNMNYNGADWVASFVNAAGPTLAPTAASLDLVDISATLQPFMGNVANTAASSPSFAVQAFLPLVDVTATPGSPSIGSNVTFGTVQYVDPYPTTSAWTPVYQGLADAQIANANGDAVENFFAFTAPLDQTGNAAIKFGPIMSTIQNPKMNGADLFTTAISTTTSVVLSWGKPSGSVVPFGYDVNFFCVSPSCPANASGHVYTADTTVTLPPGLLVPGFSYEFDIAAMADSVASIATSPLRSGYPQAWADVISAQLDIDPNAVVAQTNGVFKVIAQAAPKSFVHTKSGSFVKTANAKVAVGSKARMLARFNLNRAAKSGVVAKVVPVAK